MIMWEHNWLHVKGQQQEAMKTAVCLFGDGDYLFKAHLHRGHGLSQDAVSSKGGEEPIQHREIAKPSLINFWYQILWF